jgi:hypothetical protein
MDGGRAVYGRERNPLNSNTIAPDKIANPLSATVGSMVKIEPYSAD